MKKLILFLSIILLSLSRDKWRKERAKKYKKSKTRGDKGANLRKK